MVTVLIEVAILHIPLLSGLVSVNSTVVTVRPEFLFRCYWSISFMSPPVISHSWSMVRIYGKVGTCDWAGTFDR
jgi:hypothetical protein